MPKQKQKEKTNLKKFFFKGKASSLKQEDRQTDRQRNRSKATRHMPACFNYTTNGTNAAYSHIEKEKDKKEN